MSVLASRQRWEAWLRLLSLLKPTAFFAVVIVGLPLLGMDGSPFYSLVGGLYQELSGMEVGIATFSLFISLWSLLFAQGLVVGLAELLFGSGPEGGVKGILNVAAMADDHGDFYLPPGCWRFFNTQVTWPQVFIYGAIGIPAVAVMILCGPGKGAKVACACLGFLLSLITFGLAVLPSCWAREDDELSFRPWPLLLGLGDRRSAIFRTIRKGLNVIGRLGLRPLGKQSVDRIPLDHFAALTAMALLLASLGLMTFVFHPLGAHPAPGLAYLHWLLCLTIWLMAALGFYGTLLAARLLQLPFAPPIWFAAALLIFLGQWVNKKDHTFKVDLPPPPACASEGPLEPIDVAAPEARDTLVVVASAGGGIQAAASTAHILRELAQHHPRFAGDLRLLSTVSGGAVGTAFVVDALSKCPDVKNTQLRTPALDQAFACASEDGLPAVAWGFVSRDFPRLALANVLPKSSDEDRGLLLEQRWGRSAGYLRDRDVPTLPELRCKIRAGLIPGFIFNTSTQEDGRRVCITPMDMPEPQLRARTLSEVLVGRPEGWRIGITLFSAARLSATFPVVSPMPRAGLSPTSRPRTQGFHFGDGGYTENFGVASALEWLDAVIRHERTHARPFKRVLILQIRSFATRDQGPEPSSPLLSTTMGPLLTLMAGRNGQAEQRNAVTLEAYLKAWKRLEPGIVFKSYVLEPRAVDSREEPLSWRMTPTQRQNLTKAWELPLSAAHVWLKRFYADELADEPCTTPYLEPLN